MMRRLLLAVLLAMAGAPSSDARTSLQPPDAGSAQSMTPVIAKRELSNGLRVWVVEQHDLAVVQMSLLVLAGTDADPRGQYGIASLTSAMLTEGAGSRSAVEIADALDGLLANLTGSSNVDSSSVQLSVPVPGLAEALPLMADASQRPTFPNEELETVRQQRMGTLRSARGNPDAIGAMALARGIYGPSHRSAAALIGTPESLAALTAEALRTFHEAVYRPDNSILLVVGDVTAETLLPVLEIHFGKWQPSRANPIRREPVVVAERPPRQLMLVDLPGAPQSRILVGGVVASSSMADFFPLQVLNTLVRGRLNAERNSTLRDYTAGVRSGFDVRKSATPFVLSASARSDQTAESLKALAGALTEIVKGIPAEELTRAKDEIAVNYPKTFEATGRLSSRLRALESLVVYDLPQDYYSNYVAAIRAVSLTDIQRVAQQYFDPDHLTMVVVGDRKTIEAPIRAMNLGSIKDVTIDEVFALAK